MAYDPGRVTVIQSSHHWNDIFERSKIPGAKPMLIDFTATWCPPCRFIAPVFVELAEKLEALIEFIKIDVDDHNEIAEQFEVQSMPTFVLLKDGKEVGRLVGADKQKLHDMIKPYTNQVDE